MKQNYRVGMYERLSREDGDSPGSESIHVQRMMLEAYCRAHEGLIPVQHYSDDGYSGTSFERPAFQSMLLDIDLGLIDCVMVKDLSRFGRDYIEMGRYMERVFPEKRVRFISVNDGIDSASQPYTMLTPVMNVFHTQYARDISQKVRSAIAGKHAAGQFTGPSAPYGYRRSAGNHNRLEVDDAKADTVKAIFRMYLDGVGKTGIASRLNKQGVASPGQSRRDNGFFKNTRMEEHKLYWNHLAVHRILNDSVYIGRMRAGKTKREQMNGKRKNMKQEAWRMMEHTHPAIIPYDIWEEAQQKQRERKRDTFTQDKSAKNLFAGMLFCGECGKRLKLTQHHGRRVYVCGAYKTSGPAACTPHEIGEDRLANIVLEDINAILGSIPDIEKLLLQNCPTQEQENNKEAQSGLRARIAGITLRKQEAYESYKDGRTERVEFTKMTRAYDDQIETLQAELEAACAKPAIVLSDWTKSLIENHSIKALDRETVTALISQITVDQGNKITVHYKLKGYRRG